MGLGLHGVYKFAYVVSSPVSGAEGVLAVQGHLFRGRMSITYIYAVAAESYHGHSIRVHDDHDSRQHGTARTRISASA